MTRTVQYFILSNLHILHLLESQLHNNQGFKSVTIQSYSLHMQKWLTRRVTEVFKLCEIKVSLCSKKVTKAYDPLFRNARENRDNKREKNI